jgi:hypothetical protein
MKLKNIFIMKDFLARLTSYKTTVMALITGLLTILVATGVISSDSLTDGLAASGELYDAVVSIGGAIVSVILLFSKDSSVIEAEVKAKLMK